MGQVDIALSVSVNAKFHYSSGARIVLSVDPLMNRQAKSWGDVVLNTVSALADTTARVGFIYWKEVRNTLGVEPEEADRILSALWVNTTLLQLNFHKDKRTFVVKPDDFNKHTLPNSQPPPAESQDAKYLELLALFPS